jgi:hypothetical protein
MQGATDTDNFFTFKGGETSVSFVGKVGDRAASSLTKSPALDAAAASFAAVAEERSAPTAGSASDRLAAIRASIGKSRATAEKLGVEALGVTLAPREAIILDSKDLAAKVAMLEQKFGAPAAQAGAEPSRPITPAPAKSGRIEKA